MNKFELFLFTLILGICAFSGHAEATTPLPPAPAQGWCYDSFTTPNYNGVRACQNTPPPNDPGAYTMLAVSWLGDSPAPHTIDVTRCENLWGRMTFTQTPIVGWPYRTPTVRWNKTDNRYLRCRITMPANPGTLSHSFKTVNYSSLIPVKMALVAPGAPWPTGARTACFIPLTVNDQPALYVNPGAPNTSKCSLGANQQADLLIDAANGQRGQIGVANY